MKCDKNYFHVTPEHLTPDRLAQRSTGDQTAGTRMLSSRGLWVEYDDPRHTERSCGYSTDNSQKEQEI